MVSINANAAAGDRGVRGIVHAVGLNGSTNSVIANYKQDWPRLWTCIGQECIGRVYQHAGKFGAFDAADDFLGELPDIAGSSSRHLGGSTRPPESEGGMIGGNSELPANLPKVSRQHRWRQRNPLKRWAHVATASALRRGLLERRPCVRCSAEPADAHHPDYQRPLLVVWLCRKCHKREHRKGRA